MAASRRSFLQAASGVALAGKAALGGQAESGESKKVAANDHVQVATIGLGGMGTGDTETEVSLPGVKLVAVADLYEGRRIHAKESFGQDVFTTADYREVLARKDVDAVIIATPDHWHSTISIDAMRAGKDVYCQKPMVQHLDDGAGVIAAQKETGRIMQVGSQRVSSVVYKKAQELLKAGSIGQVNMIEAWWDRNSANGAWQYSIPTDASPETVDWDRFLGRAPKRPFDATRFFRWRNYQDYGTGVAGDLFVHLFSGMHFITGAMGPSRVFATGGLRFWKDGRDVPDVMLGLFDYDERQGVHPAFNLALRVNFVDGSGGSSGFRFIGSEGIMTIGNGVTVTKNPRETEPGFNIETFSKAEQKKFLEKYHQEYPERKPNADSMRPKVDERFDPPHGYSDEYDHHANFIQAVRTRKPVVEDPAFGFRAAGPALLALKSYFEQKAFGWDPEAMAIKG